jgi:hypothetical protein
VGEHGVGLGDGEAQLLQPPRHPHIPGAVPEVAPDLTDDGGDGEAGEVGAALGVKPVDRLDEPDHGRLHQVVEQLTAPVIAVGEVLRQRRPGGDRPLAQPRPGRVLGGERLVCGQQSTGVVPVGLLDGVECADVTSDGGRGSHGRLPSRLCCHVSLSIWSRRH